MLLVTCLLCDAKAEVARLLAGIQGYSSGTDSGVAPCPACGKPVEFRVRSGSLILGYTYWAGSFHFEGMVTENVPGLRWAKDGVGKALEYEGTRYLVPE